MENKTCFEFNVTGVSPEDIVTLMDAFTLMVNDIGGNITGGYFIPESDTESKGSLSERSLL